VRAERRHGDAPEHGPAAPVDRPRLRGTTPHPGPQDSPAGNRRGRARPTTPRRSGLAAPGNGHTIKVRNRESEETIETTIDYRKAGSRASIPTRIDTSKCKRVHGINVYNDHELAERKLQTVIGESARQKPRDLYDAGWLVHERPELITSSSAAKLKEWMASLTPDRKAAMRRRMRGERVIRRCDVEIWPGGCSRAGSAA